MSMETIEQRIGQVSNDREHGSRWLVREALLIVRDVASVSGASATSVASPEEQMRRIVVVGRTLAQSRPAMAALSSAIGRVLNVQGGPAEVVCKVDEVLRGYEGATQQIATYARPLLTGRVMTCSISGTVLDVLVACRANIEEVITLEGRPRYEGRAMAEALSRQGIAVTLITDAQADIFMPRCNAVVVGADSVLAQGDVLNKAGTALLAWAARGHGCPFYVLCETLKISAQSWSGDLSLLEEKEPEEVLEQPLTGVKVHNYYFDRTPPELVTSLITEQGILDSVSLSRIVETVRQNEQVLR
jgi:ribose 1,5-bisphosphate isomerase